jgi:hypothetical protein
LGEDLNVTVGQINFVALRFNYFRDMRVLFEAFTADALDWWVENTARRWATGCDFPAVRDKRVALEEFPIRNVGVMQAFPLILDSPNSRTRDCVARSILPSILRQSIATSSTVSTPASPAISRGPILRARVYRMDESLSFCSLSR